ncbi:MAG: hypothetical protein JST59_01935 [Actinobacteria bacterium]|nr:hypothetical protein [Actinomycetota bacterium]
MFLTYTFTTFVITFLLKANIYNISFKSVITMFVTNEYLLSNANSIVEYKDFTRVWYADIGYQIVINWVVLSLIPHIFQPILLLLGETIEECNAKKERLQRRMEKAIEGKEFAFEDYYANILMIVFVSVALCGPVPILLFIGGVALLTRYFFWKYYFIRFCKITPTFDESLNSKVTGVLYWAVILHLCFSIYAYGNTEIFPLANSIATVNTLAATLSTGTASIISTLITRCALNWLLTCVLAFVLLCYVLKTFFVDSIISLVKMCSKDKLPTVMLQNNMEFTPGG